MQSSFNASTNSSTIISMSSVMVQRVMQSKKESLTSEQQANLSHLMAELNKNGLEESAGVVAWAVKKSDVELSRVFRRELNAVTSSIGLSKVALSAHQSQKFIVILTSLAKHGGKDNAVLLSRCLKKEMIDEIPPINKFMLRQLAKSFIHANLEEKAFELAEKLFPENPDYQINWLADSDCPIHILNTQYGITTVSDALED